MRVSHLPRGELRAIQLERLKTQLARVTRTSPFYRERFEAAGFNPDKVDHIEDFSELAPTVAKADFLADQEAHPPFGTRLAAGAGSIARFEVTSGTSGLGQEVYGLTWRDIETLGSHGAWAFSMHGIRGGDRIAVTLPLGFLQGPWGGDFAARALGCAVLHLGLAPDTERKLQYLARFGINALYTPTPTFLMRLTKVASEMGLVPRRDTPNLRVAMLAGESYPLEWALAAQEFWGIRLTEVYGSTQGAFAVTCEHGVRRGSERGSMHNPDWDLLLEVVDPSTGAPVAPGETGEAIITTLVREASPTIRFRTGDLVRLLPHDGCPCGRQTVAIEAGTIGRLDDMIKVKGMNIWPAAVDSVIFAAREVEDYNAEVTIGDGGRETVTLRVALRPDLSPDDGAEVLRGRLGRELHAVTNVSMDIAFVPRSELSTFEYKAKRWTDHRPRDLIA
jgi:phenylacetate-CoA ligase